VLTFERLGAREVLSLSGPMAGLSMDAPHSFGPEARELQSDFSRDPFYTHSAGGGPIGASQLDMAGRPAGHSWHGPPSPPDLSPSAFGAGGVIIVVPTGEMWTGGSFIVVPSVWRVELVTTGSPRGPAPPRDPGLSTLALANAATITNDSADKGQPLAPSVLDTLSVTDRAANALATTSAIQAAASAAGNLQIVPSLPSVESFELRQDRSAPAPNGAPAERAEASGQADADGGLIELESPTRTPFGPNKPGERTAKPNSPLGQEQLEAVERAFRSIVDFLDRADEFLPSDVAGKRKRLGTAPAELVSESMGAASFDDGGTIELTAGQAATQVNDTVESHARLGFESLEPTIDAGVAFFHAFELGTQPVAAPPADLPTPREVPAADDPAKASREKDRTEESPRRAAANVGLGLLAAVPFSLSPSRARDKRLELRRAKNPRS
jgi:hypothetical protein